MPGPILALLSGAALVGGCVTLVVGLRGTYDDPARRPGRLERHRRARRARVLSPRRRTARRVRGVVAVAGGALVWLFTGWFVAGLVVGVAVVGLPWLLAPTRPDHTPIERLDALAEWTRRVADLVELGAGLENAIVTSRATCPEPIEAEVRDLVGRLQSRWRPEEALRVFASDLADSTSDKIAAALILRAEDRGPGLALALKDLAGSVREEVRQRRAVEADRTGARVTVRWITYLTLAVSAAVVIINRDYAEPYGTLPGQLVLALLACAYAGVLLWLRSMAAHKPVPRFLVADRASAVTVPGPATTAGADPAAGGGVPAPAEAATRTEPAGERA